ncbi:MAG: toxin-antitoxin system YwqK family antitoxin [Flavobacteriales bacterium]|nr:toxin-antitoxin system YwqK family antitoxin [Flavobacteriales bacterium]
MFRHSFLFLLLLAATRVAAVAQDTLNVVDEMGRKQGYWKVLAPRAEKPEYDDGQLIEEGRYSNSKRVGKWKRYWPNGNVMSEINYQMGRPKGEYVTYYPNGKTEELGNWDLDRNTGKFQRWHPNGKLAQEFVFNAFGVRDGEQKYYHENGQLAVQVSVDEGKEDGALKRYDASGQVTQVAQFNEGVINEANSKWIKPVKKADDVKPDPKAEPAPAPAPTERTNAMVFRENGYNTLYDKQLRLSQQGEFKEGRLWDGKRYEYDSDGMLQRIKMYKQGRYLGDAVITEEDLK